MIGKLAGKKTYVTGALVILGAIGGLLTGEATLTQAFQVIGSALLAMFVRNGITTEVRKALPPDEE